MALGDGYDNMANVEDRFLPELDPGRKKVIDPEVVAALHRKIEEGIILGSFKQKGISISR
ncbi:MAG: hypothetical protein PVF22_05925 [Candidatus Aminicenantes bacterium]